MDPPAAAGIIEAAAWAAKVVSYVRIRAVIPECDIKLGDVMPAHNRRIVNKYADRSKFSRRLRCRVLQLGTSRTSQGMNITWVTVARSRRGVNGWRRLWWKRRASGEGGPGTLDC